ncbi:uncharacterized protein [Haliotis asinina]|uniref:uncharacterized protein isoform X2 n=1 Tax=Haliotis asinina TaxID=109174 RepID=UPI003531D0E0
MFQIVVVIVASLLEASCVSSTLVSVNDPGGHRCYSCPSVEEPYLCNVTTQCRHDEQCYTDEYSTNHGGSIFSVGCRRNADCHAPIIVGRSVPSMRDVENLKCEECCQGDLCNGGGCSAGIGKGNVCYSCNLLQDPRQCKHEKRCQANEHCYIEKVFTQHYHIKFNLGCVENAECERLRHFGPPVGKRDKSISTMCASCCYGDKCNDVCFLNGPSMNTNTASTNGVQSSLLAASSVQELSTVRYGITASPFTSTAQSTHGTSHLKELSTICHADCDGVSGCILPKIQTCSGATPYCFTQVNNNYSGNFNIKKRCADRTTCNTKWWQQTSDEDRCVNYKQGTMDTFTCFYCCTADRCNLNNIKPTSLFKGDA